MNQLKEIKFKIVTPEGEFRRLRFTAPSSYDPLNPTETAVHPSLSQLVDQVNAISFQNRKVPQTLSIQYKDEEGDLVTVTSDFEWAEALRILAKDDVKKIFLVVPKVPTISCIERPRVCPSVRGAAFRQHIENRRQQQQQQNQSSSSCSSSAVKTQLIDLIGRFPSLLDDTLLKLKEISIPSSLMMYVAMIPFGVRILASQLQEQQSMAQSYLGFLPMYARLIVSQIQQSDNEFVVSIKNILPFSLNDLPMLAEQFVELINRQDPAIKNFLNSLPSQADAAVQKIQSFNNNKSSDEKSEASSNNNNYRNIFENRFEQLFSNLFTASASPAVPAPVPSEKSDASSNTNNDEQHSRCPRFNRPGSAPRCPRTGGQGQCPRFRSFHHQTDYGICLLERKQYNQARNIFESMIQQNPTDCVSHYNLACTFALMIATENICNEGRQKLQRDALSMLSKSIELGYSNVNHLVADADFDSIKNTEEFAKIVADLRAKKEQTSSSSAPVVAPVVPIQTVVEQPTVIAAAPIIQKVEEDFIVISTPPPKIEEPKPEVVVVAPTPAPVVVVAAPTVPVAPEFEAELRLLANMGFPDRAVNLALLKSNNGDINTVVAELLN